MNEELWTPDRFTLESIRVRDIWDTYPKNERTKDNLWALLDNFPLNYRAPALALLQCGYDAKSVAMHQIDVLHAEEIGRQQMRERQAILSWKREGRAFWCGAALLGFALTVSLLKATPNPSATLTLRVMVGLGVALMIAFLPGLFSIDTTVNHGPVKVALKVTGGIAGFVMIYLFDPGWISALTKLSK